MKKSIIIIILLLIINIIIGLNRRNGFDYEKTMTQDELYQKECDEDCLKKWTKADKKYTRAELSDGLNYLKKTIGIDTIKNAETKIAFIAAHLYSNFNQQIGNPSDFINSLKPLQQLQYLSSNSSEHRIWCGNFQAIFGFLSTSAGLSNRYVEITTFSKIENNYTHEVNEVYLEEHKKWVMTDVTRNRLLIKKKSVPVSTAEYFDINLYNKTETLQILKSGTDNSFIFDTLITGEKTKDKFFNKDFFLRYYLLTDLQTVYSLYSRIKRYVLPNPWFIIYDPQNNYSNILFRVRQLFILLLGISVLLFAFLLLKKIF